MYVHLSLSVINYLGSSSLVLQKKSVKTIEKLFHDDFLFLNRSQIVRLKHGIHFRVLLLTRHAFTLRDLNARQFTRTQLYGGDFNARKEA